ncbi:NAD(P)-binding Rossmann-fold containing protein [Glarea lozoyensis ATCC 20868]|uniref:NAD(P)-binding Rossmann-fold containing protein n=1 Tax=Glarea lozoyensis (strain ATCC 20868 / MF5171) TaxID=1116229 RepID=S3E502_GLAL2|nr:NAD(P)-binding Rossmann-fold containing protein [Glarea lozoyensis ATCC 20868]EPE33493.1 NAD(P)-binding Rossmann-fold containing protein [Glarea lozoyensis ATCC 20868]
MANSIATEIIPLSPVLITGGCGFIGSHLVEEILASEPTCQIHVIDINTTPNRLNDPRVTYHTGDISRLEDVEAAMSAARPCTIFHVACPDSMVTLDVSVFQRVNINGAQNLLDAAEKIGSVKAFINTSTSSVIHDNISDLINADENLPVLQYPVQKRVYTLTKAEAEALILAANRKRGDSSMLTVSMRPATAFGERDTICMGKIVSSCRQGKGKFQIGPGKNQYDFIYIKNLVDAHLLAAYALLRAHGKAAPPKGMRIDGETFNVTNDERILFWEFNRLISASVGFSIKNEDVRVVPKWVALLMAFISEYSTWIRSWGSEQALVTREAVRLTTIERTMNGEKAKRLLGYKPKVSIREGIEKGGKWFMDEAAKALETKKTV